MKSLVESINDSIIEDTFFIDEAIERKFTGAKRSAMKAAFLGALSAGSVAAGLAFPPCGLAAIGMAALTGVGAGFSAYDAIRSVVHNNKVQGSNEREVADDVVNRSICLAKKQLASEKDPEKRKQLAETISKYNAMRYNEDGSEKSDRETRKELKKYLGDDYEDAMKKAISSARKVQKESLAGIGDRELEKSKEQDKKIAQKYHQKAKESEEPDEEVVKDNSGVEWIKRRKERGDGFTYCRRDDRSVTMSQDEYRKHNRE